MTTTEPDEDALTGRAHGVDRPTIAQIATEAKVSVPTVSKVLNGRPDVAAATRARVEAVIERYGYRRRRAPSSQGLIELVFHELDNAWAVQIMKGVEEVAGAARLGVVLTELGGSHRPRQEWLDDVLSRRPAGVILVQTDLDLAQRGQLEARAIPFVVVDTAGGQPPGVPVVGSANWAGGLAATRHLVGLGHTRIAVVSGPSDVLCSRARIDGYRSALEEAGYPVDPDLIRYGDFFVNGGYAHGMDLLDRPDRPTAIFAGSDFQALGVMRAAADLGLRIPQDLSIVGYDDVPVTEWITPRLTTVRQPLQEMAATAARMVLDLAHGRTLANPRIDLAIELVVRESTAPPPDLA
ncbi:LacI family DNA-binding transcriptional regulator [Cellulomonas composti]|uniref:Transcriptional regulator n=1 Tax=Cellulomonas composti TaxID=266130 RepID=A0A511J853_9CELL|nr:LacI family DNA-binding transcriptional regulator [Cellulomonas composti]GEL93899.1 transcriptional regulator [Cellulomonas composti]